MTIPLILAKHLPDPVGAEQFYAKHFLVATVSQDGSTIGIDHPTDADWSEVQRAHAALRDRLNERLSEQDLCPHKPVGDGLVDSEVAVLLVENLRVMARGLNVTIDEAEILFRAATRIAELEARLEVVPGVSQDADGIACRDYTIQLRDNRIKRLEAENKRLTKYVQHHLDCNTTQYGTPPCICGLTGPLEEDQTND